MISSHALNQDSTEATGATAKGPVFIIEKEVPTYVLLTLADYQKLTQKKDNILDLLACPGAEEIDFEPPRLGKISASI